MTFNNGHDAFYGDCVNGVVTFNNYEGSSATDCTGTPQNAAKGFPSFYNGQCWVAGGVSISIVCGSEPPSPPATCRSDICGDIGDDCCAPFDEARSCTLPGYTVTSGGTSSFGASARTASPRYISAAQHPIRLLSLCHLRLYRHRHLQRQVR